MTIPATQLTAERLGIPVEVIEGIERGLRERAEGKRLPLKQVIEELGLSREIP